MWIGIPQNSNPTIIKRICTYNCTQFMLDDQLMSICHLKCLSVPYPSANEQALFLNSGRRSLGVHSCLINLKMHVSIKPRQKLDMDLQTQSRHFM